MRPSGCRFHPRCPFAQQICEQVDPPLEPVKDPLTPQVSAACHFAETALYGQEGEVR
jgi:peptide/nickel transport system ATP-binding protein